MYGLSKILVSVEVAGDPPAVKASSRAAVQQAALLAARSGAEVTLLTVLEGPPGDRRALAGCAETPMTPRLLIERIHADLAAELKELRVRVQSRIEHGEPGSALIRAVLGDNAGLVMAGGSSEEAMDLAQDGETVAHLLQKCPAPVWIARGGAFGCDQITIIAIDDLEEESEAVLPAAVTLAQATDARLLVLHPAADPADGDAAVWNTTTDIDAGRDEIRRRLESRLQSRLAHTDYRTVQAGTRIEVSFGAPEGVIADAVKEFEAALLILKMRGTAGDTPPAVNSSLERLLKAVSCSVLILKSDDVP